MPWYCVNKALPCHYVNTILPRKFLKLQCKKTTCKKEEIVYVKPNKKYMNDYDENKETSYIQYCDVNNLYGWTILEQFLVNNAEWVKDTSQVNEDFIKKL